MPSAPACMYLLERSRELASASMVINLKGKCPCESFRIVCIAGPLACTRGNVQSMRWQKTAYSYPGHTLSIYIRHAHQHVVNVERRRAVVYSASAGNAR
eukprot:6201370-Pleurochrysis_carterae.AAC.2